MMDVFHEYYVLYIIYLMALSIFSLASTVVLGICLFHSMRTHTECSVSNTAGELIHPFV